MATSLEQVGYCFENSPSSYNDTNLNFKVGKNFNFSDQVMLALKSYINTGAPQLVLDNALSLIGLFHSGHEKKPFSNNLHQVW
ncbi:MAG: hypothetical protein HOF21_05635 [Nitrospina sp.]|jgi:hypothetical protein|nr:hypothetical protein [Nitrospina sp.]MBT5632102.1 hypothetical protein [Nitrospina sp.]